MSDVLHSFIYTKCSKSVMAIVGCPEPITVPDTEPTRWLSSEAGS